MRLPPDDFLHLTYCTNIHAADGWDAVEANLHYYGPRLKARFSPDAPFGLGLRLSARDARELLDGDCLAILKDFLDREGLYVALINGFPHGAFHRSVVKAEVYAPDWRDPARVRYTLDLVRILRVLLPADLDGGVSTAPLSYKLWLRDAGTDDWKRMVAHVVEVGAELVRIRQSGGPLIHLDIEPEPDCAIENTDETIDFFERWLLPQGAPRLASALGHSVAQGRLWLLDHVRVCFDCCHFAVEYEDPNVALDRLRDAGIQIGRVQLSSALKVPLPRDPDARRRLVDRLRPFADPTYLHQVIERHAATPGLPSDDEHGSAGASSVSSGVAGAGISNGLSHYPDLSDALAGRVPDSATEWRIHFHVPLFAASYDGLDSTQPYVRTVLSAAKARRMTRHLEIETYTWDVLPPALKIDLLESIAREYDWVLANVQA